MICGRMKSWATRKATARRGDRGNPLTCPDREKASYPQAPNCFKDRKMFNFRRSQRRRVQCDE